MKAYAKEKQLSYQAREPMVRTKRRKRKGPGLLPVMLFCLFLFGSGFLLGRTTAAEQKPFVKIAEKPETQKENSPGPDAAPGHTAEKEPAGAPDSSGQAEGGAQAGPQTPSDQTESPAPRNDDTPEKAPDAESTAWNLVLVNWENALPDDFSVPELTQLKNGHSVDSRIYDDLQAMMDAARAEGLDPIICSAFRTQEKQETLFNNQVRTYLNQGYPQAEAEQMAAVWVARPGCSEHQVGLAVDIVSLGYQVLDEKQMETATQKWLMKHCAEYGFILRYPVDKSDLTGVGFEPWHYRYVGKAAAEEIMDQGICLEEYLQQ